MADTRKDRRSALTRQERISTCGKRQFLSWEAANKAGRLARRRQGVGAFQPYRCPVCRHWHYGHRNVRDRGFA